MRAKDNLTGELNRLASSAGDPDVCRWLLRMARDAGPGSEKTGRRGMPVPAGRRRGGMRRTPQSHDSRSGQA
jgi:hypothetical protein